MKKIKTISIFLLSLSFFQLKAQLDSTYIEKYEHKISAGLKLGALSNNFIIGNKEGRNYNLNSSIIPVVSLWFKYKKLPTIIIGVPLGTFTPDSLAKTTGISIDLKGQVAKGFILDGYLFFERGFNFQNRANLQEVRPMPKSINLNGYLELFYIFNYKKFSYKSLYLFGENQTRSTGSFTLGGGGGFFLLNNKKSFFKSLDGSEANIDFRNILTFNFSFTGGYMHNFVFGKKKNWMVNVSAYAGPNFNFGTTKFFHAAENYKLQRVGISARYKAGITHHHKKWIFSLVNTGDFVSFRPSVDGFMNSNIIGVQLTTIYKFKSKSIPTSR
ncbi:MAG: DUF4421 family protein [Chitinophagales bacterium]